MLKFIITEDESSQRLDRFLRKAFKRVSVSLIYKLIRTEKVMVNGKSAAIGQKLEVSDEVIVLEDLKIDQSCLNSLKLEKSDSNRNLSFRNLILYEDDDIIVIDKPAGLASHAGSGHESDNLNNMLLSYLNWNRAGIYGFKPALINRLDKETSGLILAAKSGMALRNLNLDSRARKLEKVYLALVYGALSSKSGEFFDLTEDSKYARLEYRVKRLIDNLPELKGKIFSLVEVRLITGRTHQIRFQFASRSHPIVGDKIYGYGYGEDRANEIFESRVGLKRHFLHSHIIGFQHPRDGRLMKFCSELPSDLKYILS